MAASCFGLPFRPAAVDDDPFLKLASFLTQVVKGRRRTARSGWSRLASVRFFLSCVCVYGVEGLENYRLEGERPRSWSSVQIAWRRWSSTR